MSDFDKFFKEKLDEEGQFPRRDKNWKALYKRLDAFGAGLQQQGTVARSYLRYWQAAAAFAVLTASLLAWKMLRTQSENADLRQEMAVLREKNNSVEKELAASKTLLKSMEKQKEESSQNQLSDNKNPHTENQFWQNNTTIHEETTRFRLTASDTKSTVYGQNKPFAEQTRVADSIQAQTAETTDAKHFASLNEPPLLPTSSLENATVASEQKPDLKLPEAAVALPKPIEPVRSPSRFQAGVQILAGLPQPQEKGVSLLMGQGITAEYNLWKNLWATASADWLRFDVSTEKYRPKFHPKHKPSPPEYIGPPQFKEKLVKVESVQRQQQFGLGLRYAFPSRFWVRPSVRVSHSWTRVSPELLTLKYQKHGGAGPGGGPPPKYKVQKSDTQIVDNTWRFGAGLEKVTPNWVFGLWADYSKSLTTNDPSFDMLLFRAGVLYRFN